MRLDEDKRRAGVLLHISSLPGAFAVGDLGCSAYRFADVLAESGFRVWQTLPLTPVLRELGNSPYSSDSAFAGNTLFISPEKLVEEGLLREEEIAPYRRETARTDYEAAASARDALLPLAWRNFCDGRERFGSMAEHFEIFCCTEAHWLDDFSLYAALGAHFGCGWQSWPEAYRRHDRQALDAFLADPANRALADFIRFKQFLFFKQWEAFHSYCAGKGISLVGDLPFYIGMESADVWAGQEFFDLDGEGRPNAVAGVPPDYFSVTGQLWGNPLYRWETMQADGFSWWRRRLSASLRMFDVMRVDHFRGLCAYWAVPAGETTAVNGEWRTAPGDALLRALDDEISVIDGAPMPLIAEDLGVITDDVRNLMHMYGLPGMKVLQFAFSGDVGGSLYAPHNYERDCVCYTGTHDNNTAAGWWSSDASEAERSALQEYVGRELSPQTAAEELVRLAFASVAELAVVPAQDLLRLGGEARMNRPGEACGSWEWRLSAQDMERLFAEAACFRRRNELYGR